VIWLQKRVLLLTGAPGVGKTSVIVKTLESLKAEGIDVGGMISIEARESNVRVGFEIIDLTTGKHGWLSHVNYESGPQVGKYRVNIKDLENIGANSILDATEKCSVIVVDEIGPMELFSQKFKQAVKQAIESGRLVLAVMHAKAKDQLINEIKERKDTELIIVTLSNRDRLPEKISRQVLSVL
jgi:nucleoside-triphosphatase